MAWADTTWQNGQVLGRNSSQSAAYANSYPQAAAYANGNAWAQAYGTANWHQPNAWAGTAWSGTTSIPESSGTAWSGTTSIPENNGNNGTYVATASVKVGSGTEAQHEPKENWSHASREEHSATATIDGGTSMLVTGGPDGKMGTTLRGTYSHYGTNHSRPLFRKPEQTNSGPSQVLIYFWDERDGVNMSGWWFGPVAGGDQVWAFNADRTATTPPSMGWRVPFDGPIDPTLCVSIQSGGTSVEEDPLASLAKRVKIETTYVQSQPAVPANTTESATISQDPGTHAKPREAIDETTKQRQAEELATWMVRSAMKKLTAASTAVDLEECSTALETAQAEQWPSLGENMQKELAEEISATRQQAQQRVRKIEEQRIEEEKLELEKVLLSQQEERRLREERERLDAVIKTAEEHAGKAESEADAAHSKAGMLINGVVPLPPARTALQTGEAAEEIRTAAAVSIVQVLSDIDSTIEALQVAAKDATGAGSASNYAEAKSKLKQLQEKMRAKRASLNTLACSLAEALEVTRRRVVAEQYEEKLHQVFSLYDRDGDERLSCDEVRALALGEHNLELPEAFLERVQRILIRKGSGVPYDRFRRLRQMLGVEATEVRKRKQIQEEEQRRQCAVEEAKRKRRDIAERKLKAQSLLDDASEFLDDLAKELARVEEVGRPLLAEERLNSMALRGVCESTEVAFQPFDVAAGGAQAKLDEAFKTLGEDLGYLLKPELLRLRGRLDDAAKRVGPLRDAVATARERASKKEREEEKAQTRQKALSKLERAYEELEDGGTSDEDAF